jgi:uncharacterized protein YndB with AHSA1/START domain
VALGRRLAACAACAAATAAAATPALAAPERVRVSAKPGLTPAFRTAVHDYVSGCRRGRPLRLEVRAPAGGSVSVDGADPRSGHFKATVQLGVGRSTELVARFHGHRTRHHVRCLPRSFPRWRFRRYARPQAQWYLFAPSAGDGLGPFSQHVILMDGHGVPVWWRRGGAAPFNSLLLPDGNLAWTRWYGDPFGMRDASAWEVHRLDGSLVRTLRTLGSPTDTHDMEPLPNGNFLLLTYRLRRDAALAPYGGEGTGNVMDGELQELTPAGKLVWSWSSRDHIKPSETTHSIGRTLPDGTGAFDVFHLNSAVPDGHGGLVISARHTDSVYRLDRATGAVTWKLGGTKRPQSLRVEGDPRSPTLRRQHDARVLPDGTVTVFDNRSGIGSPRAVRFRIDASSHTARWLEQATDPESGPSGSEGSARRLPGGHWVVSWGGTKVMSEIAGRSTPVWRLKFSDVINYRLTPIPFGQLKATTLRRAMDRMFPREP